MTGTLIEIRDNHRFDEQQLADYLANQLPELGILTAIEQFVGGQSNPTFRLSFESGRKIVMRKKPPGRLLPSAHMIDREYRVQKALQDTGVPVPRMLLFCEDSELVGTSFYLMDYLDGIVITDVALPEASSEQRSHVYQQSVETLAVLHQLDYQQLGLSDFGKTELYLQRQTERWQQQYQASKTEEIGDMDRLGQWLLDHLPTESRVAIAHGDYRLGNQIYSHDNELIAVLDWELATLGDPLADLAYHCIPYDLPAGNPAYPGLAGLDSRQSGIPSEEGYLEEYCRQTGRSEIPSWPFYMAFSYYRLASICQGVYYRGIQGNASDAKAIRYGEMVKRLVALGVRRAGLKHG